MGNFEIEPDGATEHGPCPDCGEQTRSIWGYVYDLDGARAVYFIRWTDGHLERGAQVLVSVGTWGDGTTPDGRDAFGLEFRMAQEGPQFMLVDAADLPWSEPTFGRMLVREQALSSSLKSEVFGILDAVIEQDARFRTFFEAAKQN